MAPARQLGLHREPDPFQDHRHGDELGLPFDRRLDDQGAARVPLRGKMGTAWDTAYAALFLASDEAQFITGEILRVDGGMGTRIG